MRLEPMADSGAGRRHAGTGRAGGIPGRHLRAPAPSSTRVRLPGHCMSSPATATTGSSSTGWAWRRPGLGLEAHGVRLDTALRRQRPGYPALAWLLSGGRPAPVAWALLVVNVLGLGVLGLLGGLATQVVGRHALWGLLVPGFPGSS